MRGENVNGVQRCADRLGSPPLARGKLDAALFDEVQARITPACAGKTSQLFCAASLLGDHPRLRGENYKEVYEDDDGKGSPPLARGKPDLGDLRGYTERITPACAGKTWIQTEIALDIGDHPRLRGENHLEGIPATEQEGSPPLARGKQYISIRQCNPSRITPACAGKTVWNVTRKMVNRDHPRLRGENPWIIQKPGITVGITPACAGKTARSGNCTVCRWDHPRLRGENRSVRPF